jgi:transcription-repair coupling factor (superfamily II helicase)
VTESLDLLPSLLPPEGVEVVTAAQLAASLRAGSHRVVSGLAGSAAARVAASLVRAGRSVLLVGADADAASRLFDDAGFHAAGATRTLVTAPDAVPHAEVNPDRRAAMARLAALGEVSRARLVVTHATALARKVVPRAVLAASTRVVRAEEELDRDELVRQLVDAGYLRVPVVEDPGTLAVRGAICDVWPVGATLPVRFELYGDLVVRIERFDPQEQTTREGTQLDEVVLPPAREALLGPDAKARADASLEALFEEVPWATQKAHKLKDDVLRAPRDLVRLRARARGGARGRWRRGARAR